jgi:hypothetical protein
MSGGTDASILGYGKITPLSHVNGSYVNKHSINDPAIFTSKMIPSRGLVGAANNVSAASGKWVGGAKVIKKKIKNITKLYKRMGTRKMRSMKRRVRSRINKRKSMRVRRSSRKGRKGSLMRGGGGGYGQYQNNLPNTPSYSVGGILSPKNLGEANPPPIMKLPNCTNCVDNYNHYTGKGFFSKGN